MNMHYLLFRLMYIRPLMSVYFQTTIKFRFSASLHSVTPWTLLHICATFIIFAYFKLHDLFINRHKEMHKVDYQDYKCLNQSEIYDMYNCRWLGDGNRYLCTFNCQLVLGQTQFSFSGFSIWDSDFFEGVQFIIRF